MPNLRFPALLVLSAAACAPTAGGRSKRGDPFAPLAEGKADLGGSLVDRGRLACGPAVQGELALGAVHAYRFQARAGAALTIKMTAANPVCDDDLDAPPPGQLDPLVALLGPADADGARAALAWDDDADYPGDCNARIAAFVAPVDGEYQILAASFLEESSGPYTLEVASDEGRAACTCSEVTEGIDVSQWQGVVRWPEVRAAGKAFAFIRVSHGVDILDTAFARNWPGARDAGLVRGPYQFFLPEQDALAQADLFLARLTAAGGLAPGDLPPVLDLETTDGQPPAQVIEGALAWLARVEEATGRRPLVYTAAGVWGRLGSPAAFAAYPLWVANYNQVCPMMPRTWDGWQFWQYSNRGAVAGISAAVDLDHFAGSLAQLLDFAAGR